MDKDKLNNHKEELEAERAKLMDMVKGDEKMNDFGSDTEDNSEEQDETENFSNKLAIAQTYRERIADIDSALAKIMVGDYGKCEFCQGQISEKELDLVPETRLCENCKQKE
ncbi:MAG: hypothetical protein V1856_01300 [Candidatus Liptonbacteria bacterium]